jgi:hypothetical protein
MIEKIPIFAWIFAVFITVSGLITAHILLSIVRHLKKEQEKSDKLIDIIRRVR